MTTCAAGRYPDRRNAEAARARMLVGYIDIAESYCAAGWAPDPDAPDRRIALEMLVGGYGRHFQKKRGSDAGPYR